MVEAEAFQIELDRGKRAADPHASLGGLHQPCRDDQPANTRAGHDMDTRQIDDQLGAALADALDESIEKLPGGVAVHASRHADDRNAVEGAYCKSHRNSFSFGLRRQPCPTTYEWRGGAVSRDRIDVVGEARLSRRKSGALPPVAGHRG